jgi:hypothetical protein
MHVYNVFADRAEQLSYLRDVAAWIKRVNEILVEMYRFWSNKNVLMKAKFYIIDGIV